MNIVTIMKFYTRNTRPEDYVYRVFDDGSGNQTLGFFASPELDEPTTEEMAAMEAEAISWEESSVDTQRPVSSGDFFGFLDTEKQMAIMESADSEKRVKYFLDFLGMNGAMIKTRNQKTIDSVMFLAGDAVDGKTIKTPVLTRQEAEDWLAAFN